STDAAFLCPASFLTACNPRGLPCWAGRPWASSASFCRSCRAFGWAFLLMAADPENRFAGLLMFFDAEGIVSSSWEMLGLQKPLLYHFNNRRRGRCGLTGLLCKGGYTHEYAH